MVQKINVTVHFTLPCTYTTYNLRNPCKEWVIVVSEIQENICRDFSIKWMCSFWCGFEYPIYCVTANGSSCLSTTMWGRLRLIIPRLYFGFFMIWKRINFSLSESCRHLTWPRIFYIHSWIFETMPFMCYPFQNTNNECLIKALLLGTLDRIACFYKFSTIINTVG